MSETVEGKIRKVLYHKVGKGSRSGIPFLIAALTDGRTVKGEMLAPRYDETYRFVGETRSSKFGDAFEFEYFEEVIDRSSAGVAGYLARKIDGLGKKKAAAVVEALGDDCLRTLQNDASAALAAPGVTTAIVEAIAKHFRENRRADPVAVARLLDMFADHRFPRKLAEQVATDWGSDAPNVITENPYILLGYPRMGWAGVDPFAVSLGYDPNGTARHRAAIVEAMEQVTHGDGHTYATRAELDAAAFRLLGTRPTPPSWVAAVSSGDIVCHEYVPSLPDFDPDDPIDNEAFITALVNDDYSTFSLPRIAYDESAVASKILELYRSAVPFPFEPPTADLNDDQADAVRQIFANGVFLLLGAPGTGKSYTVSRVIKACLDANYRSIRVVAPTGKAAKRAEELIASATNGRSPITCSTVHKALEPTPSTEPAGVPSDSAKFGRGRDGFSFSRGPSNPIEADLIVIDETSMLDVSLARSLFSAVAPGTRVLIVGDDNQLPSVGPGSVLRDLRESGVVPCVELSKIVRSDGGGRVVRACHALKDGKVPEPAPALSLPLDNWVHVERPEAVDAGDEIERIISSIRDNGNYDPVWGVQVVAAQKALPYIGTRALNERLSNLLNPSADRDDGNGFAPPFRRGDKVVRTKNGVVDMMSPYDPDGDDKPMFAWDGREWTLQETAVVNGDTGTVLDIATDAKGVHAVVRFRAPERLCRLAYGEAELEQAYAMTVHKAQGSGYPIVIVPVSHLFYWNPLTGNGLFSRELFYTALSRAEVMLITVGPWSAVEAVVGRKTVGFRRTRLRNLLLAGLADTAVKITEDAPRPAREPATLGWVHGDG